jgi:hypothetical protein
MRRSFGREAQETVRPRGRRRAHILFALLLGLLLACIEALPSATPGAHARPLVTAPSLSIVVPAPGSNNIAEGPVGANITVAAQNLAPGDTYHIGYATQDAQCQSGFQNLPEMPQAAADGTFTQTLVWPTSLNAVGALYYICAQDATTPTNPVAQSQQLFRVEAAQAPSVSVQAVSASTSGSSTGPATLYTGVGAAITGKNFVPGGLTLLVYLLTKQVHSAGDLQSTPLNTLDNSPIKTQDSGAVSATVQVPPAITPGRYFLYVVSNDGQGASLPSLVAFTEVMVTPPPTVTPTPKPTSTPNSGATGNGNNPKGFSTKHIIAIVALAVLSLVLIVLGIVLLASAAALPRQVPGRPLGQ